MQVNDLVAVSFEDNVLTFSQGEGQQGWAQAGTARAIVNNMVKGVSEGFEETSADRRWLPCTGTGQQHQLDVGLSSGCVQPAAGVTAEAPATQNWC